MWYIYKADAIALSGWNEELCVLGKDAESLFFQNGYGAGNCYVQTFTDRKYGDDESRGHV